MSASDTHPLGRGGQPAAPPSLNVHPTFLLRNRFPLLFLPDPRNNTTSSRHQFKLSHFKMKMSVEKSVVFGLVTAVWCVLYGSANVITDSSANELTRHDSIELKPVPKSLLADVSSKSSTNVGIPVTSDVVQEVATLAEALFWPQEQNDSSFEGRKKKYKKHEVMMIYKLLMGLKVALLGVVLPFGLISAQLLSWKAVTLSLLAFMLAKIVFVKNLFMTKTTPPATTSQGPPPLAPIIIQGGSPAHESVWKRQTQPKIHLQPEVHVHQASKDELPSPSWQWAEEGRAAQDPHLLAFSGWLSESSAKANIRPKD